MKYLCLVYINKENLKRSDAGECLAYAASLSKAGRNVAAEALRYVPTGTTVRMRDGNASVTDGPFAETKEHLAGFYVVDVSSHDEAVGIVSKIPSVRWGRIEIRPILELDGY